MSETVKPAVTPDEWAAMKVGPIEIHGDELVVTDGAEWAVIPPTNYHAAAALALHGQPFGFTWEDVDAVRVAAEYWTPADGDSAAWGEHYAVQARLRDLAVRIAALLPPFNASRRPSPPPAREAAPGGRDGA